MKVHFTEEVSGSEVCTEFELYTTLLWAMYSAWGSRSGQGCSLPIIVRPRESQQPQQAAQGLTLTNKHKQGTLCIMSEVLSGHNNARGSWLQ